MSEVNRNQKRTLDTRKEPRFKTREDKEFRCETTLSRCGLRRGMVVDISSTGIRLLCEGDFEVGQPLFTELTTERSHGIYKGTIRRVQPLEDGRSILGCSLEDAIPQDVLDDLADEGVLSRRVEDRRRLNEKAKLSWQQSIQEVEIEVEDYSPGGMRIKAPIEIPEDSPLQVRFDADDEDEQLIVEAKSVWYSFQGEDFVAGVQFTDAEASDKLVDYVGKISERSNKESKTESPAVRSVYMAACIALLGWIVVSIVTR